MTDPIINQAAQQAAQRPSETEQVSSKPEVSEDAQTQFEQALNQPQNGQNQPGVNPTNEVQQVAQVNQANLEQVQAPTLGDAILEGLKRSKGNYDARAGNIESQMIEMDGREMSVQDLMKLQYEMSQMFLELNVTEKIGSESSKGVKTLFTNQ